MFINLGNFTSSTDLNLILAKVNHIEILSVSPEGLRPIKQFTINGRVEVMKFFRPQVFTYYHFQMSFARFSFQKNIFLSFLSRALIKTVCLS